MKRTLLFIAYVLTSITMFPNDYLPFVELGKKWNVVSVSNPNNSCDFEYYVMTKAVERDGKTYFQTYLMNDILCEAKEEGLFREENRRVYKYDEKTGRETMLYDFSLKEGDTFTYEYGLPEPVKCKVLTQGYLDNGPKIVSSCTLVADTLQITYRWLHTWTIGRENEAGGYDEFATWVECVGTLGNMFDSFESSGKKSCLAYVERADHEVGYNQNEYLPFSFSDIYGVYGQKHGCDLPTGVVTNREEHNHQLTYELEGNRLHVYGSVYTNCGPNNYAFFHEEKTADPLTHRIIFQIQAVEPIATCMFLHATNFYVPGFDPNMNYIVVDNQGEEHPVVNLTQQTAYRPMIEDGKVWKVGCGFNNPIQRVEYYYFNGDTIIDGKTCKQMMCQRYFSPDYPTSQSNSRVYIGAWYEEAQKVYICDPIYNEFWLMYDFSLEANDTLQLDGFSYVVGPRQMGGYKGFKGFYRHVMLYYDRNQRYNITWFEGVGSYDIPTTSVYHGYEDSPWKLMSCTVGDEVIYFNDAWEDGATPEAMEARKRFDFTHTTKEQPKAPQRREAEQPLYGEYNDLQLGIHLDPLDEAYLVRIADETGKAVYEKAINAGCIMGLNIDISAYTKGRYTVTVENSRETFTGEFETEATGVVEVKNKRPEASNGIYNLQGQRLTGKPSKGVYIENGRKKIK